MQRITLLIVAVAAAAFGAWTFQSNSKVFATDLAGNPVEIISTMGKPMLVNFWASWCGPCVVELPLIERYAAENSDQLDVLAVAIDTLPHVNDFLKEHPVDLPIAVGTALASELMIEWGNDKSALPFSVLLSADGDVLKFHLGPFDEESLVTFVSE